MDGEARTPELKPARGAGNETAKESRNPRAGRGNILAQLFVETVRAYLETLPAAETGWLAGLRDPVVGQALAALHGEPAEAGTVESLARHVGISRSVLAERFMEMVGHPPMQYLALWRMQLASRLLAEGGAVAAVASAVGYESEAARSRNRLARLRRHGVRDHGFAHDSRWCQGRSL